MKNNTDISNLALDVSPTASGSFVKDDLSVLVSTSNETGYTLTMANNDTDTSLHHVDTNITTAIPSISTSVDESNFPVNSWAYSLGDITSSTQQFSPIPLPTSAATIKTTANPSTEDTTNVTFATKVDTSVPAGTYQDTIVFSVTANRIPSQTFEFSYTGDEQEFVAPYSGFYKVELWGAQGSTMNSSYIGGSGAYTSADIYLTKNENLYVYTGSQDVYGGYNGGGTGGQNTTYGAGGGGSTDIRLVNGLWNDPDSLKSRIMVAAGGAGSASRGDGYGDGRGGAGGGLIGYDGEYLNHGTYGGYSYGATQTKGGESYTNDYMSQNGWHNEYGNGEFGNAYGRYSVGGGGGYYGGSGIWHVGGSGGSSFISGHAGSVAIESADSLTPRKDSSGVQCTDGTTDILCSYHYSGRIFTNTTMIDGNGYSWTTVKGGQVQMPNPQSGYYNLGQGNTGNGYARITGPL